MGNLDATGPGGPTSTAVGWINAAKGVAIPLYLWWRLRNPPSSVLQSLPARVWLALTAYASLAILWTPAALPGLKLAGNMVGILLTLIVLEKAARLGYLDSKTIVLLVLA